MKVVYHPAVQQDTNSILRYYDRISPKLGDAFWEEFMACVQVAAQNPERFHPVASSLRRVNLPRFPHHFLFRIIPGGIRIIVVRHHRRDPNLGLKRR